jgi:hypothetical protein
VNLKVLATLVGHATTQMIERTYCHIEDDAELLHAAAVQATGICEAITGKAPTAGSGNSKPADASPAMQASERRLVHLVDALQRKLTALEAAETAPVTERAIPVEPAKPKAAPRKRQLLPAHEVAYRAAQWAVKENPELAHATDERVHAWLMKRPEWRDQLPPSWVAFHRYLGYARLHYHGMGKKAQRRAGFVEPPSEPAPAPDRPAEQARDAKAQRERRNHRA